MKHYGYFDKLGKLHCESFNMMLAAFKERRVPVVLTVQEFKETRSNQANRYYWGVVVDLISRGLADCGWEPKECAPVAVHEMLRREYLSEEKHVKDGMFVNRVKSTTELDTQEFGAYLEHCIRFAAEFLSLVIPEPGEQASMEL